MINPKRENFLCKECRHILSFEHEWKDHLDTYPEEKDKVLKRHMCLDCACETEDKANVEKVHFSDASFFCPKCKLYTNDKTGITSCMLCKTPLIRTNRRQVI